MIRELSADLRDPCRFTTSTTSLTTNPTNGCAAETHPSVKVGSYNATLCYDPKACNPTVHYYSNLYSAAYGLSVLAPATKAITAALKNAGVGANYSPLDYNPHGGYSQFQYWWVHRQFRPGV